MRLTRPRISVITFLLGSLACSRAASYFGDFGPLPTPATIEAHPAFGCLIMTWGNWNRSTQDSALWIEPPKFVRLTPDHISQYEWSDSLRTGFRIKPDTYMWYDPETPVLAYWEPFPGSDSLQLSWRLGDAGTFIVLHRVADSAWAGWIRSYYHVVTDSPKASVEAVKTPCLRMRPHTSA